MKILSINAKETVDTRTVAFNVDTPPAPGVMERVKYGTLSIFFENNILYVRSQPHEPSINKTVVQNLSEKIQEAERAVADETARITSKHKQALDELSKATGLPIQ